jgi:carbon monoxide dehydrogenase subunit G
MAMAVVERSIVVQASPEDIDAVTSRNPEGWPDWYVGIEAVEADDVFPEVGGVLNVTYKAAGVTFHLTQTVTEYEPGHKQVFKLEGMISGTNTWTLHPEASGTRITAVFDYQMPGGGIGKVVDKLLVERMNTKNLEESLENLKAMLEG